MPRRNWRHFIGYAAATFSLQTMTQNGLETLNTRAGIINRGRRHGGVTLFHLILLLRTSSVSFRAET